MKESEQSGSPSPGGRTPEELILYFLTRIRRRKLVKTALIFLFAAAFVNEAVRWSAVLLRRWSGVEAPVMDLGLIFFIVIFLGALMRTRLESVAALADRTIGFKDRLASFVDFRRRTDVESPLLAAQARETAKALGPVEIRKTVPIHPALFLGPLLFAVSFTYTVIFFRPYSMLFLARDSRPPAARTTAGQGPTAAAIDPAESGEDVSTDEEPGAENDESEQEGTLLADGDGGEPPSPLSFGEREGTEKIAHGSIPSGDMSSLFESMVSDTVSESLSDIVSPSLAETPLEQEQVIGRMTYRIVPEQLPAGEGADGSATTSSPVELVVDYDTIPERFRALVKTYFSILGERSGDVSERDPS